MAREEQDGRQLPRLSTPGWPDGQIVSQSDGEPADWTRPTTGWLPGEIVLDERVLEVPAGQPLDGYSLRMGLYDPTTGERLSTMEGETAVTLPLRSGG